MTAAISATAVTDEELLARFVRYRSHRRADGTVKPDAFIPPPSLNLSVSRHGGRSDADIWAAGHIVLHGGEGSLVGRADISAGAVRNTEALVAVEAPLPNDRWHANIIGWPPTASKAAQKDLAISLAAAASFHPSPGR